VISEKKKVLKRRAYSTAFLYLFTSFSTAMECGFARNIKIKKIYSHIHRPLLLLLLYLLYIEKQKTQKPSRGNYGI